MLARTILSLCDRTGNWSQPYADAGYEVARVEIEHGQDVRLLRFPGRVHGILAAPPCTHFSRAGAHLWAAKGDAALIEGLAVGACGVVVSSRGQYDILSDYFSGVGITPPSSPSAPPVT